MKSFTEFVQTLPGEQDKESDMDTQIEEEMVAGDAGGNPNNIASGKTSGAITSPGPKTLKKKKD